MLYILTIVLATPLYDLSPDKLRHTDLINHEFNLAWTGTKGIIYFYKDGTYRHTLDASSHRYWGTWSFQEDDQTLHLNETSNGHSWSDYAIVIKVDRENWGQERGYIGEIYNETQEFDKYGIWTGTWYRKAGKLKIWNSKPMEDKGCSLKQ